MRVAICHILVLVLVCGLLPPGGADLRAADDAPVKREEHTPETHLRFIEGLLARRFYDMAETELRAFLEKNPDHKLAPDAMFRLVECLRARDNFRGTISAISQFQERWPDHELTPKLLLLKGELLFRTGEIDQASACFKLLVLNADTVVREAASYFLAQCYARQEKLDLALQTYGQLAGQPFDGVHQYRPYALFALASAAQRKGDPAAAEAAFVRLKGEKDVPAGLREEAFYRLGEIHFAREGFKAAVESYESLLAEFPEGAFAKETRKRHAWAYFCLRDYAKALELVTDWRARYGAAFDYEIDYVHGGSLAGRESFGEALPLFQRLAAEATVPEEYRRLARYQQVYCLLRLEQFQAALQAADGYLTDFPQAAGAADVRYFAGEAAFRLGDTKRATADLRRSIETFVGDWPYLLDANLRLMECLEKAGDTKGAAALDRQLADDQRVKDRAYFLVRAGECERRAGDWEAAVKDFERVVTEFAQAPEAKAAVLHLGELYAERKEFARAEALVTGLLGRPEYQAGAGRAKLLFFLGYLCYRQGRYADAEKHFRESLAVEGGAGVSREVKYYLGGALIELQREEEALAIFAELLALPEADRPVFSEPLLVRLDALYFARHRYDVSEGICRWLLGWKDPAVAGRAALRLAQIMVTQGRVDEAQKLLEELLARKEAGPKPDTAGAGEVMSVLGEVFLGTGRNDQAVTMLERALSQAGISVEGAARARWGLAAILKVEGRQNQALHHAVNAFVLGDDPTYTPRAMFLAVEILMQLGRNAEALTTWKEMQVRYPSAAEEKRNDPLVGKLAETPAAPTGQGPTPPPVPAPK